MKLVQTFKMAVRVQPERGCGFSGPALRYGQPVGKQALTQETSLAPFSCYLSPSLLTWRED